ncbi:response regulator transcription factor [Brevundimonas sp.]|uniref:response regulator transcription factor n=1 Tax=Brevundimonas sp. TaxID=1871086 RepID=UPI0025CE46FD|nr:response regulator transcription factor [Brevundimonas sp.]
MNDEFRGDDDMAGEADPFAALSRLFERRTALVLEDDQALAAHVGGKLTRAGFDRVDHVTAGEDAVRAAAERAYDVLILDRITLGMDGLSALTAIRGGAGPSAQSPALFLTALGGERQRVEGLIAGADDYLSKPVGDEELLARVAAQLRRSAQRSEAGAEDRRPGDIVNGPLTLSPGARTLTFSPPGGEPRALELSPLEFAIVGELMGARGQPVTKTMLWDRCWVEWKFLPDNYVNIIDARISALRRRLKEQCPELGDNLHPLIVSARSQSLVFRVLDGHT